MENKENIKKIQPNYEELRKKSELTEKFIRFADQLDIDDKDVPKTEKGLDTKVKELIEKLERKMEKEEKVEKIVKKEKKEKKTKKY